MSLPSRHPESSRDLLSGTSAHVALLDSDGTIVSINKAWARLATVDGFAGAHIGLNYLQICDAAKNQMNGRRLADGVRKVLAGTQQIFSHEYASSGTAHSQQRYRIVVTALQGAPKARAIVLHLDVSDIKRAEAAFRRSEAELKAIVYTAVDGIVVIDERGTIESVNPSVTRLFGYEPVELIGKNVKMLMPSPYDSEHDQYLRNYLTTGERKVIGIGREVVGKRRDGFTFPISLGVSEMIVEGVRKFTGIIHDLSSRKQAEALFRQVVESAPNGMLMINPLGVITLVNKQIELMFGYSREEMIGQSVELLIPERFRAGHPAHRIAYFAAPSSRAMGAGRELYGLRKDGSEFPAELGLNPIDTAAGPSPSPRSSTSPPPAGGSGPRQGHP